MFFDFVNLYVRQLRDHVQILLPSRRAPSWPALSIPARDTGTRFAWLIQMRAVEASEVTTPLQHAAQLTADRAPLGVPTDYDVHQLIEKFDKLRLLSDPQSKYVTMPPRPGSQEGSRDIQAFPPALHRLA